MKHPIDTTWTSEKHDIMQEKVLNNPLVSHKLSILREKDTPTKEFREIIKELAILLCYESFSDEPTTPVEIETPIAKMNCFTLSVSQEELCERPA